MADYFAGRTRDGEGRLRPGSGAGGGLFDYGSYRTGYLSALTQGQGRARGDAAAIGDAVAGTAGIGAGELSGVLDRLKNDPAYAAIIAQFQPTYDPNTGETRRIHTDQQAGVLAALQNEARYREMLALSGSQEDTIKGAISGAEGALSGTFGDVMRMYDQARTEVNTQGLTAQRQIGENQRSLTASTVQGLRSRGLGNSSILDSARRSIAGDTANQLSSLSERLASLRSGITIGQAGARQQLGQAQTNLKLQGGSLLSGVYGDRAGMIERRTDAARLNSSAGGSDRNSADDILKYISAAGSFLAPAIAAAAT